MLVNAISYYWLLPNDPTLTKTALHRTILLMVTIVALIGGRVIPFFTENSTQWSRSPNVVWLELLTFISFFVVILAMLYQLAIMLQISAGLTGVILLIRWSRCCSHFILVTFHLAELNTYRYG